MQALSSPGQIALCTHKVCWFLLGAAWGSLNRYLPKLALSLDKSCVFAGIMHPISTDNILVSLCYHNPIKWWSDSVETIKPAMLQVITISHFRCCLLTASDMSALLFIIFVMDCQFLTVNYI